MNSQFPMDRWADMFEETAATITAYCNAAIIDNDGNELVVESSGCPACEERRMDWLEMIDENEVLCETCGTRYRLEVTG